MAKFKRVPLQSVPVGSVLKSAIGDPNNPQVKLLTDGTVVSQEFIDKLKSRGIVEVVISLRDLAVISAFQSQGRAKSVPDSHDYVQSVCVNDVSREIDKAIHDGSALSLGDIDDPLSATFQRPTDCPYADGLQSQWAGETDTQIESLGNFFAETCGDGSSSIGPLRDQCEAILVRIQQDQDALVCLAGSPFSSEYPSRHAVHLASMAMAVGVRMGLDHPHLMDLGIGCLIHDAGMQKIGLEQFDKKSTIASGGLKSLADHPLRVLPRSASAGWGSPFRSCAGRRRGSP